MHHASVCLFRTAQSTFIFNYLSQAFKALAVLITRKNGVKNNRYRVITEKSNVINSFQNS